MITRSLIIIFFLSCIALNDVEAQETEIQQDLATLYDALQIAHPGLFHNRSKAEYDAVYKATYQQLSSAQSELEQWAILQTFVAFGQVAHARIDFPVHLYQRYREDGGVGLPIFFKNVGAQWYVSENYSSTEISADAEITHLQGVSMDLWFERANRLISADTDYISKSILEFQFPMYFWALWELAGEQPETISLTLNTAKDSQEVTIDLISRAKLLSRIDAVEAESEAKQEPELRSAKILDQSIAWLKPGPFYNAESPQDLHNNDAFIEFIDNAFDLFTRNQTEYLIIDLRNNPGGNNSFSDHLIAWFANQPFRFASSFIVRSSEQAMQSNQARMDASTKAVDKDSLAIQKAYSETPFGTDFNYEIAWVQPKESARYNGKVVALVNKQSFSNAVSVAAIVKDLGFGIVAGESTADFATTYGAMETFTLEHSGFVVGFPKALIVRPSGDEVPGPVSVDLAIENLATLSELEIAQSIIKQLD